MSEESARRVTVLTRRKFALGLAFASVAGVAAARQPTTKIDYLGKNKLDKILPEKVGKWTFVSSSGLVVPPEDQLAQALYSQLLTRVYTTEIGHADHAPRGAKRVADRHSANPPAGILLYRRRVRPFANDAAHGQPGGVDTSGPEHLRDHRSGRPSRSSIGRGSASTCR